MKVVRKFTQSLLDSGPLRQSKVSELSSASKINPINSDGDSHALESFAPSTKPPDASVQQLTAMVLQYMDEMKPDSPDDREAFYNGLQSTLPKSGGSDDQRLTTIFMDREDLTGIISSAMKSVEEELRDLKARLQEVAIGIKGEIKAVVDAPRKSKEKSLVKADSSRDSQNQRRQNRCSTHRVEYSHHTDVQPSLHYDVEKDVLAEGSFGKVRIGRRLANDEKHAIKAVLKRPDQDPWREIDIMKRLDHPHILRLFATYEDELHVYIATELCSGGELFDVLVEAKDGFTEKVSARLLKQVLSAVDYLHTRKVCHRDLKPENFLLSEKCPVETAQVKVIDFGTAKNFSQDQMVTKICTVHYVAPEVLTKRTDPYTEVCDIWSMGVVMYMLLSAHPPFVGETDAQVMKAVKKGKYKLEPAEVWDKVSEDAKDLLAHMLEVKPEQRFTSKQVLGHRWILELAPNANDSALLNEGIVSKLRAFRSQNRLKKVALRVIAQYVGTSAKKDERVAEHVDHLRIVFEVMDRDGSGSLQVDEIEEVIRDSDLDSETATEVMNILRDMAASNNGEVDYEQFLGATMDRQSCLKEEAVRQAFDMFDLNGDGVITRRELSFVLAGETNGGDKDCRKSGGLSKKELAEIMLEVDLDGDGNIDFNEFKSMI